MTEQQKPPIDFRRFWIKFRRPDGSLLASASFNRDAFADMFGQEAADAFVTFKDSGIKRKSSKVNEEMYQQARATLDRLNINTEEVLGGRDTDRIEDL